MQKDKGVIEFLEAASILKNRRCEAQFNFIGKCDISYASKIDEKLLNKLKSKGNVNFLGYRDNINELIADSTVVVLPSYREGFPKVLQEAAACGRPIVASDVPGCREAVEDGENGLLVEPRNSQDLADKIQTLIEDEGLLKKMGLKSREKAEREFSGTKRLKLVAGHDLTFFLYYACAQRGGWAPTSRGLGDFERLLVNISLRYRQGWNGLISGKIAGFLDGAGRSRRHTDFRRTTSATRTAPTPLVPQRTPTPPMTPTQQAPDTAYVRTYIRTYGIVDEAEGTAVFTLAGSRHTLLSRTFCTKR